MYFVICNTIVTQLSWHKHTLKGGIFSLEQLSVESKLFFHLSNILQITKSLRWLRFQWSVFCLLWFLEPQPSFQNIDSTFSWDLQSWSRSNTVVYRSSCLKIFRVYAWNLFWCIFCIVGLWSRQWENGIIPWSRTLNLAFHIALSEEIQGMVLV